jgi:hypothetical protein
MFAWMSKKFCLSLLPSLFFFFFSVKDEESFDLEAAMLSSISSLKLQLLPSLSIGNCCSNFHALLNDFLYEGCGAASENHFHCLQENKIEDDPRLVVCCGWHGECKKKKQEAILAIQSDRQTIHR